MGIHSSKSASLNCPVVSNFNILKTLTLLMHAGLFWYFHNPLNSDMNYRIFNVYVIHFECVYTWGTLVYSLTQRTYSPLREFSDFRFCALFRHRNKSPNLQARIHYRKRRLTLPISKLSPNHPPTYKSLQPT